MEKYKKVLVGVGIVLVLWLVGATIVKYTNQNSFGTSFTQQTSNSSYTDSADLKQNVQAAVERLAGRTQYQLLQANSSGIMEPVLPTALAGDWKVNFVNSGSVVTKNVTTTFTAAEVCDSGLLVGLPLAGNATPVLTLTLPPTNTLFSDCLTANGDSVSVPFNNSSAATSTLLVVGTGGTTSASSTLSVPVTNKVYIDITRDSDTTYLLSIIR